MPDILGRQAGQGRAPGQMGGVGLGGGTDVPPLDVPEDVEAFALGVGARAGVNVHPGRAQSLIHGDLRFDRGDQVADGVDDGLVENQISLGQVVQTGHRL